ncbi:MAG: hypothetical protein WAK95_11495, partial [Desulfobacterales bacterium]
MKRIVTVVAITGTLYHIYIVIHPFTPLSALRISLLDLTQVQRAVHVFLISILGYLVSYLRLRLRPGIGALPLAGMTMLITIEFFRLDLPAALKVFAIVIWACTMLPTVVPKTQKWSNLACAVLCFLPFVYLVVNYEALIYRAIMPEPWDMIMSFAQILLVLGVIFRLSGPIMPTIVMFFLLYNLYGDAIPGL